MADFDPLTTVMSTKGQVILPKGLRDRRRWSAGTRLIVEERDDGVFLRPAPAAPMFPPKTVEEVCGMFRDRYKGPPVSIEEMDAGVMAEARRRARY